MKFAKLILVTALVATMTGCATSPRPVSKSDTWNKVETKKTTQFWGQYLFFPDRYNFHDVCEFRNQPSGHVVKNVTIHGEIIDPKQRADQLIQQEDLAYLRAEDEFMQKNYSEFWKKSGYVNSSTYRTKRRMLPTDHLGLHARLISIDPIYTIRVGNNRIITLPVKSGSIAVGNYIPKPFSILYSNQQGWTSWSYSGNIKGPYKYLRDLWSHFGGLPLGLRSLTPQNFSNWEPIQGKVEQTMYATPREYFRCPEEYELYVGAVVGQEKAKSYLNCTITGTNCMATIDTRKIR